MDYKLDESTDLETLKEMIANMTRRLNDSGLDTSFPPTPEEDFTPDYKSPTTLIMFTLCILSILANLFSLFVVCNIVYKTSHIRLIMSLCLSDALVGVASLLQLLGVGDKEPCSNLILDCLSNMAFIVSLLNLLFMGMDHYLAIVRPLHYPLLMTSRRGIALIICLWFVSAILGHSEFVVALPAFLTQNDTLNFCDFSRNRFLYDTSFVIFAIILLCFLMKTFIYSKILVEIKSYRERATNNPDLIRNRKALITTFIILGTFTICWVPLCLINVIAIIHLRLDIQSFVPQANNYHQATQYFKALMLLNALLDPIIYAIRMPEVRRSYRKLSNRFWMLCNKKGRYTAQQTSLLDRTSRSTVRSHVSGSVKRNGPRDTVM